MHFRLRAKYDKNNDHKSIAITFVIRHVSRFGSFLDYSSPYHKIQGDILVMDGAGVQEYYECVVIFGCSNEG